MCFTILTFFFKKKPLISANTWYLVKTITNYILQALLNIYLGLKIYYPDQLTLSFIQKCLSI